MQVIAFSFSSYYIYMILLNYYLFIYFGTPSFLFFKINLLFIYLFLSALGLHCCAGFL